MKGAPDNVPNRNETRYPAADKFGIVKLYLEEGDQAKDIARELESGKSPLGKRLRESLLSSFNQCSTTQKRVLSKTVVLGVYNRSAPPELSSRPVASVVPSHVWNLQPLRNTCAQNIEL